MITRFARILRSTEVGETPGGNPPPGEPTPAPVTPVVGTAGAVAGPPAAEVVTAGKKSEREILLEQENTDLLNAVQERERKLRDREIEIATVLDENARLKNPTLATAPSTTPAPPSEKQWLFFKG